MSVTGDVAAGKDRALAERLYTRLYMSLEDFRSALFFLLFIIEKRWHGDPWEKKGSTYVQQSAFTSATIMFYSRAFTESRGFPKFPDRLIHYDESDLQFHRVVIGLRNQVYAHSDASRYRIRPLRIAGQASAIVSTPFFKLTVEQAQQLRRMILITHKAIEQELEGLMLKIEASKVGSE
jgi:hypothetical protein